MTYALKQEGRGSTGSGEQARTRRVLVITEFALSLVLMIAAGLLLRSFADLMHAHLGYNPQSVMTVRTWLPIPNDPRRTCIERLLCRRHSCAKYCDAAGRCPGWKKSRWEMWRRFRWGIAETI